VEQVRYAGYLHDIGKVAVPLSLLQRGEQTWLPGSGGLRLHPQIGAVILQPVHFLRPAAQMVHSHHERWDGLGYPQGLRQARIPLGARILALADACVTMTESGLKPNEALSQLRQGARSRFDPQLLEALQGALSLPD
jgi:HD-GYP domain-containing protein (c-di-GMP phosphodiesterase class II)